MLPFTYLRRHSALRRLGQRLERGTKAWLYRALTPHARGHRTASPAALDGVRRVLLVRPNFRIGNAVIGARLIQALAEGRPDMEIDYLGTDTTHALFAGMPLSNYHALSRGMLVRPWRLLTLVSRLRRRRYDLAIQVGEGSLTGWAFTRLCRAHRTLGQRGRLEASYDWVGQTSPRHAHEQASTLAGDLGLPCPSRPWLVVTMAERAAVAGRWHALSEATAPLGIFVGGHLDKRLPLAFWQALMEELERRRRPYLVLLGPEEAALRAPLERACSDTGHVLPQLPLRDFLAVLANLGGLITPDTGPMHLAAALEVPVIALLRVEKSRHFAPRGAADLILFQPTPGHVAECACAFPTPPRTLVASCPGESRTPSAGAQAPAPPTGGNHRHHAYSAG